MRTMSEFWRERSNTISLPFGVMSNGVQAPVIAEARHDAASCEITKTPPLGEHSSRVATANVGCLGVELSQAAEKTSPTRSCSTPRFGAASIPNELDIHWVAQTHEDRPRCESVPILADAHPRQLVGPYSRRRSA